MSQLKFNGPAVSDSKSKAEILSNQYQKVFTKELNFLINLPSSHIPIMEEIVMTIAGVQKLLSNLNTRKAIGPDLIFTRALKEAAS